MRMGDDWKKRKKKKYDKTCMFIKTKEKCARRRTCLECLDSEFDCGIHKTSGECWRRDYYQEKYISRNVSQDLYFGKKEKFCREPTCLAKLETSSVFCYDKLQDNCISIRECYPKYSNGVLDSKERCWGHKYRKDSTQKSSDSEMTIAFVVLCGFLLFLLGWWCVRGLVSEYMAILIPRIRKTFRRFLCCYKTKNVPNERLFNQQLRLSGWQNDLTNNLLILEKKSIAPIAKESFAVDSQSQQNVDDLIYIDYSPQSVETLNDLRTTWHSAGACSAGSYSL